MNKDLKLLILEDNQYDAELEEHELKEAGINFTSKVVPDREAFIEALKEPVWDAIISDYSLRNNFTGMDAFQLFRKASINIPFILVTGALPEDVAINCIKEGMDDYILKGRIKRLPTALENALEKKRTEREKEEAIGSLRESEEILKIIFEGATDGLLVADIEKKTFLTGNRMICEMLGYTLEEIKKMGIMAIHPEKELLYVIDQFERQAKGEFSLARNIPVERKDGTLFYADVNSSPITIKEKKCLLGIFRDITERKQMEEKILKYIDELEHFQAATVQREFRMKDLRDENDRLKKEIEDLKLKSR